MAPPKVPTVNAVKLAKKYGENAVIMLAKGRKKMPNPTQPKP